MADPRALGHALLSPGPAPNGRDKVFDTLYGWLGGKPENRWAADKLTTAIDWGTLGMLTGAYDGGKELAETGRPASLAMALMPGAKVAAPAAQAVTQAAKKGIRAFHGSPHDFDRFDLSKIGTGEGAQAYGHGLYFAENEGVAKGYRQQLATWGHDVKGMAKTRLGVDLDDAAAAEFQKAVMAAKDDPARAAKLVQMRVAATRGVPPEKISEVAAEMHAKEWPGRMYEVNIKADPEDFLDWDKPLTSQPDKVKSALSSMGITKSDLVSELEQYKRQLADPNFIGDKGNAAAMVKSLEDELSGSAIYRSISPAKSGGLRQRSVENNKVDASTKLREAGIPGIRYLDQGSRTVGEGSSNYVVFDDALIEILRKYGLLPPAGAAGLAAALQSSPADAAQ